MAEMFTITREIGIDMGHRVTYHGSKCRNLHGHRYTIQATCEGKLFDSGEQEGMVLDFGFLKEEMMDVIDLNHDHGTTLWRQDPILTHFVKETVWEWVDAYIMRDGFAILNGQDSIVGKLTIVPFVPTAENLTKFWFQRLAPRVIIRSNDQAKLWAIDVWETPNCVATYRG